MKIATLIIHYKINHLTDVAVAQLVAQDRDHDLFVVDCGSPEPYRNAEAPCILRLGRSRGLAGSINWAMEQIGSGYDAVWHYTNDVTCTPDVLRKLACFLQGGYPGGDPGLAAVQPSMPSWHSHLEPRPAQGWAYADYLEWAAVLVNMAAWEDVGPLDEYFNFFSMDIDWCYRARQKGWEVAVDYYVRCGHPWRGTHNVTGFDISSQALVEHGHGMQKYGREDWQRLLMGLVD